MFAAALIVFREVLEAALVITIIMAATQGIARRGLWISLGIELKEAKARNKEMDGVPWPEFAKLHFDLGQSRADELIRIADGRTNVDEVRASGAARVQKTRAGSALRNAGFPDAEQVERDRKTCIALYQKAIAADPEFAQWMAEPDDDDDERQDEDVKSDRTTQHRVPSGFAEELKEVRADFPCDFWVRIPPARIVYAPRQACSRHNEKKLRRHLHRI